VSTGTHPILETRGLRRLVRRPVIVIVPAPARAVTSRRRKARATVFCGVGFVLAALLGMAAAVETAAPHWRDPEYGHRLRQVRALRAAHPGRPLVVALGSSRTQMGVSPADMGLADEPGSPLVYSFGRSGAGPLLQHLTFRRLLDDGVKPDFLLLEIFPAVLVADGPAEGQLRDHIPRLSAGDLRRLAPYCDDPAALRRAWTESRANSWYSLRLTLMSHWLPGWLPWPHRFDFQWTMLDARGWNPHPCDVVPAAERSKGTDRVRRLYQPMLADYRIGRTTDRVLRDLLGDCRSAGIPAALYLTPEGPAFASWYTPAARAAVDAYVAGLSAEYGVPVFDAAGGFAEDEFADSHHLLKRGAARFSRELAGHIGPWVQSTYRKP
jgi:hypothetical protein